ncbi:MAG: hypothetical protein D3910_13055 [Candidatus Electrothrix sp. ATG2]|nr:hypothetical protein [Candidatus Electrothrix sp. ATG2]
MTPWSHRANFHVLLSHPKGAEIGVIVRRGYERSKEGKTRCRSLVMLYRAVGPDAYSVKRLWADV